MQIFEPAGDVKRGVVAHFKHEADDGWSVFGDVTRGSQGLVISRLEITPAEESSGVTAALLRKIPVGEIVAAVRTKAAWEAAQRAGTKVITGEEAVPGVFDEGDSAVVRRSGRAPLTQDLLRQVAMAYIDENAPGKPSGAMKRIADSLGKPEQTARNWVARARRDGWLGPSVKGRTGAEPGPKLRAWVRQALGEMHDVEKEARSIAREYGADPILGEAAVADYSDIASRDLSHRMGLPPLEAAVVSRLLFGRSLAEEFGEHSKRKDISTDEAFELMSAAMRLMFRKRARGEFEDFENRAQAAAALIAALNESESEDAVSPSSHK